MELLRVKAYQPFACYRKPFSFGFWDTYPLPPFSTILGWVHWILGESQNEVKLPMNIGIAGKFDSLTYDLQTLVKFDRIRKEKSQVILEDFNKALSSTPSYVANVTNVHLRIYIQMEKKYLEAFKNNILLVNYPSLGRYEDLMRIDDVSFLTPSDKLIEGMENPIDVDYPIYVTPETARESGIQGSNFQLPFYHKLVNNIRFFDKENVVYTDSGSIKYGTYLIDDDTDETFLNPVLIQLFGKFPSM